MHMRESDETECAWGVSVLEGRAEVQSRLKRTALGVQELNRSVVRRIRSQSQSVSYFFSAPDQFSTENIFRSRRASQRPEWGASSNLKICVFVAYDWCGWLSVLFQGGGVAGLSGVILAELHFHTWPQYALTDFWVISTDFSCAALIGAERNCDSRHGCFEIQIGDFELVTQPVGLSSKAPMFP